MAAPRLLPVLLATLGVLASGCATPAAEAPGLPAGAALLVAWAPDRWAYVLDLPDGAPDLPEGLVVRVAEKETGRVEEIPRGALAALGNGSHEASPSLRVEAGRTYVVEALVGGQVALRREVLAVEEDLQTPLSLDREVVYDATTRRTEDDEGSRKVMELAGTMRAAPADGHRVRLTFDAAGTMVMEEEDEGMRMELDLAMRSVSLDDETVETLLTGEGDWEMAQEDVTGAGAVTMRQELVGHEDKPDEDGAIHRADKLATRMTMEGAIAARGTPATLRMVSEGHEWRRADTGDLVWRASNATTTLTIAGAPREKTEREDEAVPYDEDGGDLRDAFSWEGPRPWPLVAGDVFEHFSAAGVRVRYVVEEAEAERVLGRDVAVLLVRGAATGEDATGSETWRIVGRGDVAGLPLSGEAAFARGGQTERMTLSLRPTS